MKKYLLLLFVLIFFAGCGKPVKETTVLARVNNYEITKEEFGEEFKESSFGWVNTPESKKEFLENLINIKLILQEAQKENLDKEKNFLKSIERFWEQSLLRIALERKTKEITSSIQITDAQIQEVYQKMLQEGKTDKSYDQMYGQIKWELSKQKESQEINRWVTELHSKAKIEVKHDFLK